MSQSSYRDRDYSFGQAMLTLRSAIGLTQSELADMVGVSRRAVGAWEAGSKYPKADHLKQFITLAIQRKAFPAGHEAEEVRALWQAARQKVLLDERWLAGLLPPSSDRGQGHTFMSVGQVADWRRIKDDPNPVLNLPFQSTPFIGRDAELSEIARILSDPACRLLTLLGPGGIGKTRLGIEVAASQTDTFADGVVFVGLASISTPDQIIPAIGEALHLSFAGQSNPADHLLAHLRERRILLLLDNFEHLLEGADLVYDILQHAPQVILLVTSRVRLNLLAEWLFDVEGLSYPSTEGQNPADLTSFSAVELFVQRAAQVQPAFQASPSALATIVRICQQVAGMPLAIELAAAGVRSLSVTEIEGQIRSNLDALTTSLRDVPVRHRSLRAVFDQSWNLLTGPEQVLFTRLSVFRGGCMVEAVERVTGTNLPALMTLVDKSLLRQINLPMPTTGTIEPRFFLLEPIREYALEKLAAGGETESLHYAHALYYLQLAQEATSQRSAPLVEAWIGLLHSEHDNMRVALQWACDSGDSLIGFQLAEALWKFWRSYGYISEGRGWLEQLLALDDQNADPTALDARRRALYAAAWLASDQHDYTHATQLFEQSMLLRRALGETEGDTDLLLNAARQSRAEGQYQRATALLEDALARHRALGDRTTMGSAELERSLSEFGQILRELGLVMREQGHFDRAAALFDEGLQLHRAMGERSSVALSLLGLADVARDQGDAARVREYAEECLAILREMGMQWAIGFTLNTLAQADFVEGNFTRATALADESLVLFRGLRADGSIAEVLVTLGHILQGKQETAAARDALTESVRLAWVVGPRLLVAAALEGLAGVSAHSGEVVLAARLLGAVATLRRQMGTPVRPADQPALESAITAARAALGDRDFDALWSQAGQEPLEQILSMIPGLILPDEPLTAKHQSPAAEASRALPQSASPSPGRQMDWNDAVTVPVFYGREWEMGLLTGWMVEERCRVVSVLGMGGIGKSALTVTLMRRIADHFAMIIWRSLRDVPTFDALSIDLVQTLAPHLPGDKFVNIEQRSKFILEHMRSNRVLLVLDNLESLMDEGENAGHMLPGCEGFGQFLRKTAETEHQSCVLLTSREKPVDLVPLEGSRAPVRVLRLARLDADSSEKLLAERGVIGTPADHARLVEAYTGNPLALKIVAQTVVDLFDGEIAPFLEQGEVIFGGIRELLNQQFARLSPLEQSVLFWLAVLREPSTLDELLAMRAFPVPRARLLEAFESLRRRSLIERGPHHGSVTLQSVVLEYMTARIIMEASDEIQSGALSHITLEYGFELAQAREYIREIQQRLIVAPILERLRSAYSRSAALETQMLTLLRELSTWDDSAQGYAPANLVTLLRTLRGNLNGLDLSGLVLRGVYLQGVEMHDTILSEAFIQTSLFTQTFDAVTAVAASSAGDYWATGSRRGIIRLWSVDGPTLHRAWRAHGDIICGVAFSPDGRTMATSGSWDGTVKLWDVASGVLLWSAKHPSQAYTVTFAPDGNILASTGYDAVVRLWDKQTGAQIQGLVHPDPVCGVAWSPDGRLLATGDLKGSVRLWQLNQAEPAICLQTLEAHSNCAEGLAFAPDGSTLASGSWDGTVRLWDVASGTLQHTLTDYTDRVICVAWSPDGRILASAGRDKTIWLWDAEQRSYRTPLQGHTAGVYGVAFTPDSRNLLSGSEDSTLRVWDIASAQCIRFLQGYAASLYDVDWSPDGTHLVTGGSDAQVTLVPANGAKNFRTLAGHHGFVIGVSWSSDGRWLASSEWNNAVRLWDAASGQSLQVVHFPGEGDYFDRLAWSPDGRRLAIGTYTHGLQLYDIASRRLHGVGESLPVWIRHVAWSPDGLLLAGGGADGNVYVWDTLADKLLQQLTGHHTTITDVAWSPDGLLLASGSRAADGGELFVWDVKRGGRLAALEGHSAIVYAVVWSSSELLVSADADGVLRWWDVQRRECLRLQKAHRGTIHSLRRSPDGTKLASCGNDGAIMLWDSHSGEHLQTLRRDRPYERLNITGIRGLTDAQKSTLHTLGAVEDESGFRNANSQ